MTALVLDFGGVLTSDLWEALRGFARREGLADDALVDLVTRDAEGVELLRALERGGIGQARFEREVSARLGVPAPGLLARMAAELRPDEQMLAAVARIRATGVKIGILSNSWGTGHFDPYAPWRLHERADVVVVSDQVGMRKPDPEIFDLVLDRLAEPPEACLFIDDIAAYLEPARAGGMAVWHHTSTPATLTELRRVYGE
ncbi:phosphoglycolate phosphatase [Catellatospora sp. TT07R-123]|uniref:HAD family hydrolase n=1 Tax=Catellatospora sp. TT07R-123 TaxID=2733863 RepID=UPI001B096C00|nr:HAD family phosphatase [Catellatospora sp. TT07R-123]GHJ44004.1 phosphoglycolate phosphatase [Catellatospora sp. TT07R-123]